MGSDESHFNVSLIVRDKVTRQCPQTTTFEWKLLFLLIAFISRRSPLSGRLTALLLHAILNEWLWLFVARFGIATEILYLRRCLVVTWLVSRGTDAVSAHGLCTPNNHAPVYSVTSFQATCVGACVFRCNLSPALLAGWPGSFTCYCGNTEVERIPK